MRTETAQAGTAPVYGRKKHDSAETKPTTISALGEDWSIGELLMTVSFVLISISFLTPGA